MFVYLYLLLYNVSKGEDSSVIPIQTVNVSGLVDLHRLNLLLLFPVT